MADQGWTVTVDEDGGVTSGVLSEAQASQYNAAKQTCTDAYDAAYPPVPMSVSLASKLYGEELVAAKCLEDEGYPVSEPISEQAYVDGYMSGSGPSWQAYMSLPTDLSNDEFMRLNKQCPQPRE